MQWALCSLHSPGPAIGAERSLSNLVCTKSLRFSVIVHTYQLTSMFFFIRNVFLEPSQLPPRPQFWPMGAWPCPKPHNTIRGYLSPISGPHLSACNLYFKIDVEKGVRVLPTYRSRLITRVGYDIPSRIELF